MYYEKEADYKRDLAKETLLRTHTHMPRECEGVSTCDKLEV